MAFGLLWRLKEKKLGRQEVGFPPQELGILKVIKIWCMKLHFTWNTKKPLKNQWLESFRFLLLKNTPFLGRTFVSFQGKVKKNCRENPRSSILNMFGIFVVGGGYGWKDEKKTLVTHKGARLGVCFKKKQVGCAGFEGFFSRCLKDFVQKARDWLKLLRAKSIT